jgi:ubiquinone/menaquinone biosynthesis C-methylase UbiE
MRRYASTGEAWAAPFLAGELPFIGPVKIASLNVDPRWRAIKQQVPRGATILDAGCGQGDWPVFLAAKGYRAIGLDFSETLIKHARERHPELRWECGVIQKLPLEDASVDAIISWGVIEHDEAGPNQALREFARVLRPGGHAILTVPTDSDAQRKSSKTLFHEADASEFFQYFMTPSEFLSELKRVGLRPLGATETVSRHHALAYPNLYRKVRKLHPVAQRAIGWVLRPTLRFVSSSDNMIMAVAMKGVDR